MREDIFSCVYCAGVGYEDYPMTKRPCRIPGHTERHNKNVQVVANFFIQNPLPEPKEGKPSSGNWQWTGMGWKNLDYKKKKQE